MFPGFLPRFLMMPSIAGDLSADAICIIFVTSLGAIALHKAFIAYG